MGSNEVSEPEAEEAGENIESIGDAIYGCWRHGGLIIFWNNICRRHQVHRV